MSVVRRTRPGLWNHVVPVFDICPPHVVFLDKPLHGVYGDFVARALYPFSDSKDLFRECQRILVPARKNGLVLHKRLHYHANRPLAQLRLRKLSPCTGVDVVGTMAVFWLKMLLLSPSPRHISFPLMD